MIASESVPGLRKRRRMCRRYMAHIVHINNGAHYIRVGGSGGGGVSVVRANVSVSQSPAHKHTHTRHNKKKTCSSTTAGAIQTCAHRSWSYCDLCIRRIRSFKWLCEPKYRLCLCFTFVLLIHVLVMERACADNSAHRALLSFFKFKSPPKLCTVNENSFIMG